MTVVGVVLELEEETEVGVRAAAVATWEVRVWRGG